MSKSSLRLICPNKSCINKSIVYRRFDRVKDNVCKNCGTDLVLARNDLNSKDYKFDQKAKRELKELGNV